MVPRNRAMVVGNHNDLPPVFSCIESAMHDLHMPKGGNHASVSGDGKSGRSSKPKKIALRRRYAVGKRIDGDQDLCVLVSSDNSHDILEP